MGCAILILFIVVPLVEIVLLYRVTDAFAAMGFDHAWLATLALVVVTGILGSALLRHQGTHTLRRIRGELAAGRMPAEELLSGVLLLVGGAFLLTPGILTDVAGFLLMVPGNRRLVGRWLRKRFAESLRNPRRGRGFFFHVPGGPGPGAPPGAGPDEVIGSAERLDERDAAGPERPNG
jgi:UPF0716 protein FxsA